MADKNVIIKQKLENEIIDFYPKTKSNIVVNESNITGSTVTDVFNNALPIKAGEHISITPDASGVKIDFTGSLAPNVTVKGIDGNPILVSEEKNDTSAKYTVSHFTAGPSAEYTSGNATTATAIGEDFGFHQRANTESSSTTATFKVTPDKAYLLFQTHSNHYGVYLISTYAKGYSTILDNNDGLTGLSVNKNGNKITVTSSSGRLSLIMVGRNT